MFLSVFTSLQSDLLFPALAHQVEHQQSAGAWGEDRTPGRQVGGLGGERHRVPQAVKAAEVGHVPGERKAVADHRVRGDGSVRTHDGRRVAARRARLRRPASEDARARGEAERLRRIRELEGE